MPELRDLLQDAVPPTRPFDESALRRRVGQRRRRRYGVAIAALALVAGLAAGLVARGPDEASVLTEEPAAAAPVTALTLVDDDVWTGGDGFVQVGEERFEVDGAVLALAAGDLVWAVGSTWVEPFDGDVPSSLAGRWTADAVILDAQPLDGRTLAVALSSGDVVILQWFEAETTEARRIALDPPPEELVRTLDGELWARTGDALARLDVAAGAVSETVPWSGQLLAPSRSGGIWTTDGSRVVVLHPEHLADGVSVALGARYDVTATMAVETAAGLYVGGPDGLTRHDPGGGELLDPAEPDALAGNDEVVAYLVDGEVRRAHADPPVAGGRDADFCAVMANLGGEVPEAYVGSAEHAADLRRLQQVAPLDVRPAVDTYLAYVESGAIDPANDPGSTERASWPADVQAAIQSILDAASARC